MDILKANGKCAPPQGSYAGQRAVAFFDFDGTLTRQDTFWGFHVAALGKPHLLWALLKTALCSLRPGGFRRDAAKEALMCFLWKGVPYEDYCRRAREYSLSEIDANLLPIAIEVLDKHLARGDDVYIVTASMKEWVEPWASRRKIPVIATALEVRDGQITGRLATRNCRGPEKVARIRATLNLYNYSKIYAYGNSSGDLEMLALADEKAYNWDFIPSL